MSVEALSKLQLGNANISVRATKPS